MLHLLPSVFFYVLSLQEGDFLVLPSGIQLDGTKLLIEEALGISAPIQTSQVSSGPSHSSKTSNLLKLSSQKGQFYSHAYGYVYVPYLSINLTPVTDNFTHALISLISLTNLSSITYSCFTLFIHY